MLRISALWPAGLVRRAWLGAGVLIASLAGLRSRASCRPGGGVSGSRRMAPGGAAAARTACGRVLVRGGTDEKTGEALSAAAVAERVSWCAALVQGMAARLVAGHWNPAGLESLASGRDAAGKPLPAMAWMALRRLGWGTAPPDGVRVNDRIVRMAQEQAGRVLRSACWRDTLTRAAAGTWPADPARRTPEEWDAVRAAAPGGEHLPSPVIRARTRQGRRQSASFLLYSGSSQPQVP